MLFCSFDGLADGFFGDEGIPDRFYHLAAKADAASFMGDFPENNLGFSSEVYDLIVIYIGLFIAPAVIENVADLYAQCVDGLFFLFLWLFFCSDLVSVVFQI